MGTNVLRPSNANQVVSRGSPIRPVAVCGARLRRCLLHRLVVWSNRLRHFSFFVSTFLVNTRPPLAHTTCTTHLLTLSLTYLLAYSLLIHLLYYLFTYSLTHSLTHSLLANEKINIVMCMVWNNNMCHYIHNHMVVDE